ncbi:ABC transporter ATP-binding protein [Mesorhizobium sp. BR1-1-16]|uniref:ABC transporter ATP-binding protein n=1 Tax=Mesorhizobium sp. BR1-1-16 TaxID=2876653 RepID=UPI001CCBFAA6|nr:ABC transporter ATP-binding protein [Mesorhizobium sp. BR1-1-16]MBZ9939021.1 ABC transporter ATP-binding protein [Mesorhizobium sp. BR1-1-16]
MSELVIDRLSKHFSGTRAVADVEVAIDDGELVCLLGPSGCGKSTVLRMIAGFERPTSGRILIDGEDVVALPPDRRPTGMVFQSHALWSHMTVFQNVAFGLKLRRLSRAAIREKVAGVLDLVGLTGFEARYPGQLSGGQQQRVAIARCVVLEPKILLMDEPFSALDAHLRVRLREEVRAIQRRLGLTTIFVTHDQEEALTLADRVVVMRSGTVEQIGSPSAIYAEPATRFVAGFIGTMNIIERQVTGGLAKLGDTRIAVDGPDGIYGFALRPEDLSLGGAWSGEVQRVLDLGAFRMLDVTVSSETIKVQVDKSVRILVGDEIGLDIHEVAAFDGEGRARPARVHGTIESGVRLHA